MSVSVLHPDMPSLSASSSTASSSASSVNSIPARRIRFAPLPDPRALDDDQDDDDPLHLPALPDSKPCSLSSSTASDAEDHPPSSPKPTTQQLLSHPPIPHAPSWSKPKSLNLLRPFPFRKSAPAPSSASEHSLTPTQSLDTPSNATPTSSFSLMNFSTEEILTLGTINLFRASSKSNDSAIPAKRPTSPSSSSGWGFGLSRWSSTGSCSKGSPLSRSQSAQSYNPSISSKLKLGSSSSNNNKPKKPRSSSVASTASTASSADGKSAPLAKSASLPGPVRKGTRMLNGRVYGGPKRPNRDPNANPFANARDELEFVEWGYGGMGSVRGGRHAGVTGDAADKERTKWERLQSDATFMGSGTSGAGEKKGVGGEEDDGSGMGWVKKRKEQREKEKKELEEREKAEKEKLEAEQDTPAPPPAEPQPQPQAETTVSEALSISLPDSAPVAAPVTEPPPVVSSVSLPAPVLEHNLTAVTLPAHLSRHHSHTHRRTFRDCLPRQSAAPIPSHPIPSYIILHLHPKNPPLAAAAVRV
ncbi:hypothetical protein D9615_001956 [Tricholomella constricta]|uniref:Uncharacterized protein n=1 Tax=Tricholomella constricta TaxID=117010 RepID=A0A8H5HNR6_9AGAR|nr:hypothetical protein D9615_001956 [Tricholomella constricta]